MYVSFAKTLPDERTRKPASAAGTARARLLSRHRGEQERRADRADPDQRPDLGRAAVQRLAQADERQIPNVSVSAETLNRLSNGTVISRPTATATPTETSAGGRGSARASQMTRASRSNGSRVEIVPLLDPKRVARGEGRDLHEDRGSATIVTARNARSACGGRRPPKEARGRSARRPGSRGREGGSPPWYTAQCRASPNGVVALGLPVGTERRSRAAVPADLEEHVGHDPRTEQSQGGQE